MLSGAAFRHMGWIDSRGTESRSRGRTRTASSNSRGSSATVMTYLDRARCYVGDHTRIKENQVLRKAVAGCLACGCMNFQNCELLSDALFPESTVRPST